MEATEHYIVIEWALKALIAVTALVIVSMIVKAVRRRREEELEAMRTEDVRRIEKQILDRAKQQKKEREAETRKRKRRKR